jgi:hypothetical protein
MAMLTATTAPKTNRTNVRGSSLGSTSSSSNINGSEFSNRLGGEDMTLQEILEEMRRLACPHPPVVPARHAASVATTGATATAAVPAIGVRRGREAASTLDEKQQATVEKIGHHVDHNEALSTMPGAVFVPGLSSSFYNNHDINMDSRNNERVLDIPELRQGQSSDGISVESVHLGIAVAVEVDEQQEPQVKAVPIVQEADKKQVPIHQTKVFCRIALILLISIVIIGVATITIILLGGDHDSGDEGGGLENLVIRKEIGALVGTENLESPDSPYAGPWSG